jgi:hypothetical protein
VKTVKLGDRVTVTVGTHEFPADEKFVKVKTTEGLRVWATKYVKVSVWPKRFGRKAVTALFDEYKEKYVAMAAVA